MELARRPRRRQPSTPAKTRDRGAAVDPSSHVVIVKPVIERIAGFLESIGVPCRRGTILEATFLPGIVLQDGGLIYDADKLLHPGDLLHEAGHLAVMSPERRMRARPRSAKYADEMMAIAWSYAAAVHLHLDPAVVFHEAAIAAARRRSSRRSRETPWACRCCSGWG